MTTDVFDGCIGIDLGTTFSCVSVWVNDHVEVIPNDLGNRTTPSWIAFLDQECVVGEVAKQQAVPILSEHCMTSNDSSVNDLVIPSYKKICPIMPLKSCLMPKIDPRFKFPSGKKRSRFYQKKISAMVLAKMKANAEAYLGKKVVNAVITVPAYFNDSQRTATKNAGSIAGLNCLRIINQPTASCLCYGLHNKAIKTVLIFDLGGGTLDVSLLELNQGLAEVKATNGNVHLGGEDFDNRLAQHLRKIFEDQTGKKIPDDNSNPLRKLKDCAEITKNRLSQLQRVNVQIDALYEGRDLQCQVTRNTFEARCLDLFTTCLEPIKQVLKDAEMTKKEIDEVILIGGATRIPKVQELLSNFFDGKQLNKSCNPDEAVSSGGHSRNDLNKDRSKWDDQGSVAD